MTTTDRFERELPVALSDVAGSGRNDYLTDILGRTARTSQRPAWASIERWLPMNVAALRVPVARLPWRPFAAAVLVIALILALLAALVGSQRRLPPPFGPADNGLIPFTANGEILAGDPLTGQSRVVVKSGSDQYGPSFSRDGTRLAFLRAAANCPKPGDVCPGGEDIIVTTPDGTAEHALTTSPLAGISATEWASDSRSMYVAQADYGQFQLSRIPIDGGQPKVLASGLMVDWIVARPPAGDELLVRGIVNGAFGLYGMRANGSDLRLVVPASDPGENFDNNQDLNFPAYSPDGRLIYFNRYVVSAHTIQAWVVNADGSNAHRFNPAGPACCWWEGEMAPSPDGKSIVMWRVPPGDPPRGTITLYPADGSGVGRPIGPKVLGTAHWVWSPDSTKILLNYNDPNEGDEGVIDVASGAFTPLPWRANAEPDWQRTVR